MNAFELPILIYKNKVGRYEPHHGYRLVNRNKTREIIKDLKYYVENYTDLEIDFLNSKALDFINEPTQKQQLKKKQKAGFIYVLKCKNIYKIGYTKDVKYRMLQLDNRPFECQLLLKIYSDDAYHIERNLHQKLNQYRVNGEWYKGITLSNLKQFIQKIADDLSCNIQYQEVK